MRYLRSFPFALSAGYCIYRWWMADAGDSFLWMAAEFVFLDHTVKEWEMS